MLHLFLLIFFLSIVVRILKYYINIIILFYFKDKLTLNQKKVYVEMKLHTTHKHDIDLSILKANKISLQHTLIHVLKRIFISKKKKRLGKINNFIKKK